ncbi:MAG: hypothetical protein ABFC65_00050 [Rectinema sp.]
MQTRIGKMKHTKFAILLAFLCTLGAGKAAALPALDFYYVGFANAWTSLDTSTSETVGHHYGWSISADLRWVAMRIALDRDTLPTAAVSVSILHGIHGQFIAMAASNWLEDGSRYRAWSALGLGPELGIGISTSNFILPWSQTFFVSAGVLGNLANYSQTSLYNAYISWLVKASWALELSKGLAISAALPLEYAFRADGRSIIATLNLGVRYAF